MQRRHQKLVAQRLLFQGAGHVLDSCQIRLLHPAGPVPDQQRGNSGVSRELAGGQRLADNGGRIRRKIGGSIIFLAFGRGQQHA
ncbi:hypothetical protein D3C75_949810 [compost metagenome]